MNRRIMLPALLLLLVMGNAGSQSYNTTVGMRLGTDWGITAQQRVDKRVTIEGILQSSLQREEVTLTVLGEKHLAFLTPRLNFYTGAGLHKGWTTDSGEMAPKNPFGIDFIGGLEFTFARMNLSYDFKPAINLIGGEKTFYAQTGISLRYVVNKKPFLQGNKKKKRQRQRERRKRQNDQKFNWKFWQKNE